MRDSDTAGSLFAQGVLMKTMVTFTSLALIAITAVVVPSGE
jgi:hypothetical protein